MLISDDGEIQWNLDLARRLSDQEVREATELTLLVDDVRPHEGADTREWSLNKKGLFTVSSCYRAIHKRGTTDFYHKDVWNKLIPMKIVSHFSDIGNHLWELILFAICWVLWIERNAPTFMGQERGTYKLIFDAKALLLYWFIPSRKLSGIWFHDLVLNWDSLVRKL